MKPRNKRLSFILKGGILGACLLVSIVIAQSSKQSKPEAPTTSPGLSSLEQKDPALRAQIEELKSLLRQRLEEHCPRWTAHQRELFANIVEATLERIERPIPPVKMEVLCTRILSAKVFARYNRYRPSYSKSMSDNAAKLHAYHTEWKIRWLLHRRLLTPKEQQRVEAQIAQLCQEGLKQARAIFPQVPPERLTARAQESEEALKAILHDLGSVELKVVYTEAQRAEATKTALTKARAEAEQILARIKSGNYNQSEFSPEEMVEKAINRYFNDLEVAFYSPSWALAWQEVPFSPEMEEVMQEELRLSMEGARRDWEEIRARMRQQTVQDAARPELEAREMQLQLVEDAVNILEGGE